jgi:hypothetical protein
MKDEEIKVRRNVCNYYFNYKTSHHRTSRDAQESFRKLLDIRVPVGEHPVSRNYDLQILTAFYTETRAICIATR